MSRMEGPANGFGKWGDRSVPHKGWECVGIDDPGSPSDVCEMCEKQDIRYVHEMQHPDYPDILRCGCICAGYMEENLLRAERRDKQMRAAARRRQAWPDRAGWKMSAKGNPTIKVDGYRVTIFPRAGQWGALLLRRIDDRKRFSRRNYPSIRAAQLAAFDALEFYKSEGANEL